MIILPATIAFVGATVGVTAVLRASTHSRATLWGPVLWRGPVGPGGPGCNKVALTFDDGPTEGVTEPVLDALDKLNVKATFFVIGQHAEKCPQLLKKVHDAGHLIANHTFGHSHYGYLHGAAYWRDQIEKTNAVIQAVTGYRPTFFRSPMGVRTFRTTGEVRRQGMTFVTWSKRALDGLPTTADQICERLLPSAAAGDIYLLHDGIEAGANRNPQATVEAIPRIVSALRERGLEPVRLDELVRSA
jgi:peptidoglycan/xylan/chitin deacetylase (PgdA/CDA1 family)